MADKINVVLTTRIANLWKEGELVEVSRTQAKNYLIPKWLAKEATSQIMKEMEEKKKIDQNRVRMQLQDSYKIQEILSNQVIEFTLKWSGKKVFWGINEHDIIERIKKKYGYTFERHDIKLPNDKHIKEIGEHNIYIHITRDTVAKMRIQVEMDTI